MIIPQCMLMIMRRGDAHSVVRSDLRTANVHGYINLHAFQLSQLGLKRSSFRRARGVTFDRLIFRLRDVKCSFRHVFSIKSWANVMNHLMCSLSRIPDISYWNERIFVVSIVNILCPMSQYSQLVNIIIILDVICILAGLYRPWWVLWFLYKQNRLLVLQYYGTVLLILLLAKTIIQLFG